MSKIINKEEIMENFFKEPNRWFHVRELSRILKINPSTTSKYLDKLRKEGFLDGKNERNYLLFKANTESYRYKDAKIYFNIKSIKESGLINYIEKELHFPEIIILFGSYAKGEDNINSDIDLFVISDIKKELKLEKFEKKTNRKIEILIKNKKEFSDMKKNNKNLTNSILNGIILKGYLEVFSEF